MHLTIPRAIRLSLLALAAMTVVWPPPVRAGQEGPLAGGHQVPVQRRDAQGRHPDDGCVSRRLRPDHLQRHDRCGGERDHSGVVDRLPAGPRAGRCLQRARPHPSRRPCHGSAEPDHRGEQPDGALLREDRRRPRAAPLACATAQSRRPRVARRACERVISASAPRLLARRRTQASSAASSARFAADARAATCPNRLTRGPRADRACGRPAIARPPLFR